MGKSLLVRYIAGHIPPTLDQFSFIEMWEGRFAERYFAIVDKYKDIVTAQLYGHVHCNSCVWRLLILTHAVVLVHFLCFAAFTEVMTGFLLCKGSAS